MASSTTLRVFVILSLSLLPFKVRAWDNITLVDDLSNLVPRLVLNRFAIPDANVMLDKIYGADVARSNWLHMTAFDREDFHSDDPDALPGLSSRASKHQGDVEVGNTVVCVYFSPTPVPQTHRIQQQCAYFAHVGIGSPPTTYTLVVDTGSANTWIKDPTRGGVSYSKTKSSHPTGNRVSMTYSDGGFEGFEYLDEVHLAGVTAHQQSIGVAYKSSAFSYFDGVLGYVTHLVHLCARLTCCHDISIGPSDLNRHSVMSREETSTVVDTLYMQRSILGHSFGLWFSPARRGTAAPGEISLGE
jgi:hypothetical protein